MNSKNKPAVEERKPPMEFSESGSDATILLVIDGLISNRQIKSLFKNYPQNATVLKHELNKSSISFAIQLKNNKNNASKIQIFKFEIKRLPCDIDVNKSKIKYENNVVRLELKKVNSDPWRPFLDSGLETENLNN